MQGDSLLISRNDTSHPFKNALRQTKLGGEIKWQSEMIDNFIYATGTKLQQKLINFWLQLSLTRQ